MPESKFPPKILDQIYLMEKFGRFCIDPSNTYIGPNVIIGEGTIIEPNVFIHDRSDGKNNIIGKNCRIGSGAKLREWFVIGDNVLISGAEVVRSKVGNETKIPHWCHVGNAEIGQGCNIAAGVIFCNFDGKHKHQTILADDVFVGSGAKLVPSVKTTPLKIGRGAFIAAGAIITKNVKEYALVIGVDQVVHGRACLVDEIGWEIISKNDHPILRTRTEEPNQGYP